MPKAKAKITLPVKAPPAPLVEQDWEKALGEQARDERATFAAGVPRVSVDAMKFKVDGVDVGNSIVFATLESAWAKEYYEEAYQKGVSATPSCYAFGKKEKGLIPHPAAPDKQAEACDSCPHNKFYTALLGNGKRCSDKPRLMIVLAHDLEGKPADHAKKASTYQLAIPGASIKHFNEYLGIINTDGCTPHGNIREALTRATVQARSGGGHEIKFEFMGLVPREAMPALVARGATAFEQMTQPFPVLEQQKAPKPIKGQGNQKRR